MISPSRRLFSSGVGVCLLLLLFQVEGASRFGVASPTLRFQDCRVRTNFVQGCLMNVRGGDSTEESDLEQTFPSQELMGSEEETLMDNDATEEDEEWEDAQSEVEEETTRSHFVDAESWFDEEAEVDEEIDTMLADVRSEVRVEDAEMVETYPDEAERLEDTTAYSEEDRAHLEAEVFYDTEEYEEEVLEEISSSELESEVIEDVEVEHVDLMEDGEVDLTPDDVVPVIEDLQDQVDVTPMEVETVTAEAVEMKSFALEPVVEVEPVENETPFVNPNSSNNNSMEAEMAHHHITDDDSAAFVDRMELADAYDEGEPPMDDLLPQAGSPASIGQTASEVEPTSTNVSPTEIDSETARILVKDLKFRAHEVKAMKPEIAVVVSQKRLRRPLEGMPNNWYRTDSMIGQKQQSRGGSVLSKVGLLPQYAFPIVLGGLAIYGGLEMTEMLTSTSRKKLDEAERAISEAATSVATSDTSEGSPDEQDREEVSPDQNAAAGASGRGLQKDRSSPLTEIGRPIRAFRSITKSLYHQQ